MKLDEIAYRPTVIVTQVNLGALRSVLLISEVFTLCSSCGVNKHLRLFNVFVISLFKQDYDTNNNDNLNI